MPDHPTAPPTSVGEVRTDPVLRRRARIALAVRVGKTVGYGCYLVACIAFALWVRRPAAIHTRIVVTCMVIGSIALAPAIVFGYAVRAAEKQDRLDAAQRR